MRQGGHQSGTRTYSSTSPTSRRTSGSFGSIVACMPSRATDVETDRASRIQQVQGQERSQDDLTTAAPCLRSLTPETDTNSHGHQRIDMDPDGLRKPGQRQHQTTWPDMAFKRSAVAQTRVEPDELAPLKLLIGGFRLDP
jgi:hypothetical protein